MNTTDTIPEVTMSNTKKELLEVYHALKKQLPLKKRSPEKKETLTKNFNSAAPSLTFGKKRFLKKKMSLAVSGNR